jgi:hypothetical protein
MKIGHGSSACGSSIAEQCQLTKVVRATFYDAREWAAAGSGIAEATRRLSRPRRFPS